MQEMPVATNPDRLSLDIDIEKFISVVIPNYNMAATIGKCLEAVSASEYSRYEVIVADDASTDNSLEIISRFPCRLVRLASRSGTSAARNAGARESTGDVLFFIDADCLVSTDTLSIVNRSLSGVTAETVIGGTYTALPYDDGFFNTFQSAWVNYSETRTADPDYVAAHAMIMDRKVFAESGGFPEDFMPIIEDVEFSHRLRRSGYRLIMDPAIQVRHIFGFSLFSSMRNAFRKTAYWCMYSLGNRDLFADSGTASVEFKMNVILCFINILLLISSAVGNSPDYLYPVPLLIAANMIMGRRLICAFARARGWGFALFAYMYYALLYPIPIVMGTVAGMTRYFFSVRAA